MSRIEVGVDICLMRPRRTQGCRADDYDEIPIVTAFHALSLYGFGLKGGADSKVCRCSFCTFAFVVYCGC